MLYVLEEIFKSKKSQNSEYFNLRIQRSLSWLKKALLLDDDLDLQFMSLWISFSALQAESQSVNNKEHTAKQHEFLMHLSTLDHEYQVRQILWGKAQSAVEFLLKCPYASQDYWDYKNQMIPETVWKSRFHREQQGVSDILNHHNTKQVLALLFTKMGVLRQQVLKGGTYYDSMFNRVSLQSSCTVLKRLLPQFIHILIDHPSSMDTQKPFYPMLQLS